MMIPCQWRYDREQGNPWHAGYLVGFIPTHYATPPKAIVVHDDGSLSEHWLTHVRIPDPQLLYVATRQP